MPSKTPVDANTGCVGPNAPDAGRNDRCAGCPNQGSCATGQQNSVDPDTEQIRMRFAGIRKVLLVLSGKGGVGKSTLSSQLSFTLAHMGKQVGLLDLDICGPSIPRMAGVRGQSVHPSATGWSPVFAEENLRVMSIGFLLPQDDAAIIWRGPRKNALIKQFLMECDWAPPGTSDEHISILSYLQGVCDAKAILVTTAQEISMMDVRKEIHFCLKTSLPILGLVENMSNLRAPVDTLQFVDPLGNDITEDVRQQIAIRYPELLNIQISTPLFPPFGGGPAEMAQQFNINFLGRIPMDPNLLLSCENGNCYVSRFPEGTAARSLVQLCQEIIQSSTTE